jgi:thiamine-phosphate pyrophosphorylase
MPDPLARQREVLRRIAARLKARRGPCRVPNLILMTDDSRAIDWAQAAVALPRGAAVIVRSRDPKSRARLAHKIIRATRPRGVLTLIAADIRLALRIRADGVHFPELEASRIPLAKRVMPFGIFTCSAHGRTGLILAERNRADAALLSPMFSTKSHAAVPPLSPLKWSSLRTGLAGRVIALGGINSKNALRALSVSADGIALIEGWVAAR